MTRNSSYSDRRARYLEEGCVKMKLAKQKEIQVPWTSLAKIRVQDAGQQLKEVSMSVNLLGRGHKLVVALRAARKEIKNIERLLDETYG